MNNIIHFPKAQVLIYFIRALWYYIPKMLVFQQLQELSQKGVQM